MARAVEQDASDRAGGARRLVTVYPITGRQLFFTIPHSWCEECDLTSRLVSRVLEDFNDVELRIKPWWNHLFDALRRGGWHAPVVTVDGRLFSQGVVPDADELRAALSDRPTGQLLRKTSRPRVGGQPLLTLYVTPDCPSCPAALELVERMRGRVEIEVVDLADAAGRMELPAIPPEVVATPAVMLDGRLVSLGTPDWERLNRAVDQAIARRMEAPR